MPEALLPSVADSDTPLSRLAGRGEARPPPRGMESIRFPGFAPPRLCRAACLVMELASGTGDQGFVGT